jgi:hypothetical protein
MERIIPELFDPFLTDTETTIYSFEVAVNKRKGVILLKRYPLAKSASRIIVSLVSVLKA